MKLKKYKKNKIGSYLGIQIILIILSFILSIIIINIFSKRVNEVIMPMAISDAKRYVTNMINVSTENISFSNNLFEVEKNNKNEIIMISYDTYETTRLINEITDSIQNNMNMYIDNGVISKIPLGILFKNAFVRNIGPKISVKIMSIGDILSELETEVKPYGINNALVEVRAKIQMTIRVVLPVTSKEIKINNKIPVSINVINGSVPEGYIWSYK